MDPNVKDVVIECTTASDEERIRYQVSIVGRCAVYYGRTGESHIEPFPPAQ